MNAPPAKPQFAWEDPLLVEEQLTGEERMVRDAARAYAQDKLMPRVLEAHRGEHFHREIEPILSPVSLDPARPFPRILNKSLNFIVGLEGMHAFGRPVRRAIVQAPRSLPRLIRLSPELPGSRKMTVGQRLICLYFHGSYPWPNRAVPPAIRPRRQADPARAGPPSHPAPLPDRPAAH